MGVAVGANAALASVRFSASGSDRAAMARADSSSVTGGRMARLMPGAGSVARGWCWRRGAALGVSAEAEATAGVSDQKVIGPSARTVCSGPLSETPRSAPMIQRVVDINPFP